MFSLAFQGYGRLVFSLAFSDIYEVGVFTRSLFGLYEEVLK